MNPDINSPTLEWRADPLLFYSAIHDHYDRFVENLFNHDTLIDMVNAHGETVLHYCVYYGLIDKYYALVNMGAQARVTNNGNTLLHYASVSGKDDFLVTEIVKSGFSPLQANRHGKSSMHLCANSRIAHYFNMWALRHNEDLLNVADIEGNTLAHGCWQQGHVQAAQYWVHNYASFSDRVNKKNQKWNEVELLRDHAAYCTY